MTFPFPETKTGLRLGFASAAMTGCLAVVLLAGFPVRAQDANPVLAKVNGVEIRQSDVALAEEELGPSLAQMDPATKKDNVLASLIDMKIVAKAAEDKNRKQRDFGRLAFTRNRLLMDSLLATGRQGRDHRRGQRRRSHEDAAKQITAEQEVRARHILVESEDDASDRGGAEEGCRLRRACQEEIQIPAPPTAAIASSPRIRWCRNSPPSRSRSSPARSPIPSSRSSAGTSSRSRRAAARAPAFEQVKPQIETYVTRKAQAEYVSKLREAAKIERMDKPADAAKPDAAKPADSKMAPPAKK
jgi:peptidyl-prolyl cis-trans isomerase C